MKYVTITGNSSKLWPGNPSKFGLGTHQNLVGNPSKLWPGNPSKIWSENSSKIRSGNETQHTVAGWGLFCFRLKLSVLRRDGFPGSSRSGFFSPSSAGFFSPSSAGFFSPPSSVAAGSSGFASPPPVAPSSFFPSSGF